jgi:putative MFS transporter
MRALQGRTGIVDVAVFGSLVPDMVRSGFATKDDIPLMISALFIGTLIGSIGQGELTDRFGRKAIYQLNLLIFGLTTIASALSPNYIVFAVLRFIAGIGLGAEVPLCFSYAAEFSPKRIRGRIMAFTHFIGGACSWPCAILFALRCATPSRGAVSSPASGSRHWWCSCSVAAGIPALARHP